jgi:diguanylate cyclase (GGDEF)-like protein
VSKIRAIVGSRRLLAALLPWTGLAVSAAAAGGLALTWARGFAAGWHLLPQLPVLKPNTALAVGCLGAGLAISAMDGPLRRLRVLPATLACLIGLGTSAEYAFGWDLGIDRLMLAGSLESPVPSAGRPALMTAVGLVLLGAAILLPRTPAARRFRTVGVLGALLIAWTLLNGYLFRISALSGDSGIFGWAALHTALAFLLLSTAILASDPDSWPAATVLGTGVAGVVCRWLLPAAIAAPPLLGWLLSGPSIQSSPDTAFHWAVYSVSSSAGSAGLILILAHRIELIDAERTTATFLSRHDPLTGLPNRRAFDAFLHESFALAQRYHRPLSVLSIDVDHFKAYNDTFGHPAGDEVLKAIAGIFTKVARETDLVARVGGEEFAVVMPETYVTGAHALAERIRLEVASLRPFARPLTVSIGLATVSARTGTAAALWRRCDRALYSAKRAGRNLVRVDRGSLTSAPAM